VYLGEADFLCDCRLGEFAEESVEQDRSFSFEESEQGGGGAALERNHTVPVT
jgi:hypothetical protein